MSRTAHEERLMTLLHGPHLSEKAHNATELNQVVFKVDPSATKSEIRQAVELLFEVEVEAVRVINYMGKIKRHGLSSGRRANWKKAYVRLAEGHQIDFLGGE